ncbi:MAG: SGNH/GDSL hydrolase family protein [Pyrinomonadaceae bacterium]
MSLFRMQAIYILAAVALAPVAPFLYLQGQYVRRKVGLLPDARGEKFGQFGADENFVKLLVIGESTVAGLGARTHETALAGQFAKFLSRRIEKSVRWTVIGKNGVTAQRTIAELVPQIPDEKFDYIVVGLGGNDVIKLSSPHKWRRTMTQLIGILKKRNPAAKIFITNVAAVNLSPALPQPIRGILWQLSKMHNANILEFSKSFKDVFYYPQPKEVPADFFSDGIHPSEAGYALWAEDIIKTLMK